MKRSKTIESFSEQESKVEVTPKEKQALLEATISREELDKTIETHFEKGDLRKAVVLREAVRRLDASQAQAKKDGNQLS